MSSSDRLCRRSLLLGTLALGGCGFTPVYGPDGPALALRDSVTVEGPDTVDGYQLRQHLQDQLGRATAPAYTLSVTLDITEDSGAITADGTISRFTLTGQSTYALRASGSETVLAQGSVDSFTSYAATGTTVATRSAADDARDRLTRILADLVMTRLVIAAQDF